MKEILQKALSARGAQARLVEVLDVPTSTVSNWARGLNAPEPYRWTAIEEALKIEAGTLARAAGVVMQPADALDRWAEMESTIRRQGDEIRRLREVVERLVDPPPDAVEPAPARSRRAAKSTPR
jgi:DNA-binding transcriptional regulator YdaS (Cro superfamily)